MGKVLSEAKKMEKITIDFSAIRLATRAPYLSREEVSKLSGGIVNPKTLANLDCIGQGPAGAIRVGRKVAYPVEEVIRFLEDRAVPVERKYRKKY